MKKEMFCAIIQTVCVTAHSLDDYEVKVMKISYKKLWMLLIEKEISKPTFRKELKLSTGTMSKLNKGEEVALSVLLRICDYLDCDIGDICEAVRVDKV